MRALITAGGTREPIDDVRVVTNLSRGRFGAAIANALVRRGVEVTVLGSKNLVGHPEWLDPRVTIVEFGSFLDLARLLEEHTTTPPDLLFMAAAVSDYSPIPTEGKIRSTDTELVIRMVRNPKLLPTLRERCGVQSFLVGFKLLSGVSREKLVSVATGQLLKGRLNLTVANDLATFRPGLHPVVFVTPEGGAISHRGSKDEMAAQLVDFVLKRQAVTWCRSEATSAQPELDSAHTRASTLLTFAQEASLFGQSTHGNASARTSDGFWITPRQVAKSAVRPIDLIRVQPDLQRRRHLYQGTHKPSIDSTVAAHLYDVLPETDGLVHFHGGLVLPTVTTDYPYPCGCLEEAHCIHRALAQAAADGSWDGGAFSVRLTEHGTLLGVPDVHALERAWSALVGRHDAHLEPLGHTPTRRQAVFAGGTLAGVLAHFDIGDELAVSLFLDPAARGKGHGDHFIRALGDRTDKVAVHDECGVVEVYLARGFALERKAGPIAVLIPPSQRTDVVEAASVCLVDPIGRRVLLGRRKTGAFQNIWAFPGGKQDPGESLTSTAARELKEETGLDLPPTRCLIQTQVMVGTGPRAWRVHNFAHPVLRCPDPVETPELEARWMDLDGVLAELPMVAGTKTVLRRVLGALR